MRKLLALFALIVCFTSFTATAGPEIKDMHNSAPQREINQVSQVNFTESLRMAEEIWAQNNKRFITVHYRTSNIGR